MDWTKHSIKLIDDIKKYGKKGQGKAESIKWLTTHVALTRTSAITAYCYQCCGMNMDGSGDCGDIICPLYPHSPHGTYKKEPLKRKPRVMTAEHKQKLIDGRKKKKVGVT